PPLFVRPVKGGHDLLGERAGGDVALRDRAGHSSAAAYVGALTRVDRLVAGIVRVQAVGLVFLDERFAVDDEDAYLPGLDRGAGVHVDITPVAIGGLHAPAVHGDDAIRAMRDAGFERVDRFLF